MQDFMLSYHLTRLKPESEKEEVSLEELMFM